MLSHVEWLWQTNLSFRRELLASGDRFGSMLHLDWAVWHDEEEDAGEMPEGPAGDRARSFAEGTGGGGFGAARSRAGREHDLNHGDDSVGSPIILLIHGLGDSVDHPYIKRLCRASHRVGWRVCCFSYWRADWYNVGDLRTVIKHIGLGGTRRRRKSQWPGRPVDTC